ncbi:hypothetical protein [Neobacillus niacini]|uniref:hypothetical protein n=1 Tax=Neobacillus niacini TaxID=86668 RepID=UPI00285D0CE7|nr:hypothetical protein [Neobacillus niacini]MDR7000991.1 hypothetical protein [Neobacillus niacini]
MVETIDFKNPSKGIRVVVNHSYVIFISTTISDANQFSNYPSPILLLFYYGNEKDDCTLEQTGFIPFHPMMLKEVLKRGIDNGIKNPIFIDFYDHLRRKEVS